MPSKNNKNKTVSKPKQKELTPKKDEIINEVLNMEVPAPKLKEETKETVEESVITDSPKEVLEEINLNDGVVEDNIENGVTGSESDEVSNENKTESVSDTEVVELVKEVVTEEVKVVETVVSDTTVKETVTETKKFKPATFKRRRTTQEAYGYNIGGWGIDE